MIPKKSTKRKNPLILTDKESEENADAMFSSISELAYALPNDSPSRKADINSTTRSSRSRFFFIPTESQSEVLVKHKKAFKKRKVVHVDDEIQKRVKKYRKQLPEPLEENIRQVREFFLYSIGPKTLASGAGSLQAKSVVQELLKTEVDMGVFNKFERMVAIAVDIKMAKFIAKYLKLPVDTVDQILAELNYKQAPQQHVMIPPLSMGGEEQHRAKRISSVPVMSKPSRKAKHDKHQEENQDQDISPI